MHRVNIVNLNSINVMTLIQVALILQLHYFIIYNIISVVLPSLAYDDLQLAFANQQAAMTENQINNNENPAIDNSSSSIVPKVVF